MSQTVPKAAMIAAEVRRRIIAREWPQGVRIPDEADLAVEFGAARATVNKALQMLAQEGLVTRKRRAGTHVALNPPRRMTMVVPIVRQQIEAEGRAYAYRVAVVRHALPPPALARRPGVAANIEMIYLEAVHYGDGQPFQMEERWINPATVPAALDVDFLTVNANEWLARNAPLDHGTVDLSAQNATAHQARMLRVKPGLALLIAHRTTYAEHGLITDVRITCHPSQRVTASL